MKKTVLILLILSGEVFAACSYLNQEPFTNYTNPDKNRGNGHCNEDNDCPLGSRCTAFGSCEKCF